MFTSIFVSLFFLNFLTRTNEIVITHEEIQAGRLELALTKLAECESRNDPKIINVMDGDASSFGKWQFKIKTFVWAGMKYNLPHSDIWDEKQQRDITTALLKDGQWRLWWNCSVKQKINRFYRYGVNS